MSRRSFRVTGANNSAKQVSVDWTNDLAGCIERGCSITPQDYGAVGDGTTDDGAAFAAAIEYLEGLVTSGYGYGKGSPRLFIPAGVYNLNTTTLDLNHSLIIEGDSAGGNAQAGGTVLKWAAGTTGIRTQRADTTGATGGDGLTVYGHGASATIIRNLTLYSSFAGTESEAHGVHARCVTVIRDVLISGFAGDGIYSRTGLGDGADNVYLGSSSGSEINGVTVINCRNGIYLANEDSNAWVIYNPLLSSNRRYGLWAKTTLGSSLFGGSTATNGTVAGFATMCSHNSKRYYCLPDQEVWAAANAPSGTTANNTGWGYFSEGGTASEFPAWTSGMSIRAGGAARFESSYEQWIVAGLYKEPDQPPIQVSNEAQAVFISPMAGWPVRFDGERYGGTIVGNVNNIQVPVGLKVGVDGSTSLIGGASNQFAFWTSAAANTWKWWEEGGYLKLTDGSGRQPLAINSTNGRLNAVDVEAGYKYAGTQVVGTQGAAVADATDAASAITQLNALLARCRAHGLIAT